MKIYSGYALKRDKKGFKKGTVRFKITAKNVGDLTKKLRVRGLVAIPKTIRVKEVF